MNTVKKYLWYFVAFFILMLAGGVYYFIAKAKKDTTVKVDDAKPDEKRAYQVTMQVLSALRTAKGSSGWNPSNWYEDEDTAIRLLNENGDVINLIQSYYNKLSRSGNLVQDLNSLLTESQRSRLLYI